MACTEMCTLTTKARENISLEYIEFVLSSKETDLNTDYSFDCKMVWGTEATRKFIHCEALVHSLLLL